MTTPLTDTLARIQREHKEWEFANFGKQPMRLAAYGVHEEGGELSHCHLKFSQNIRGFDVEKYLAEGPDALGDMGIYLISCANKVSEWLIADDVREVELQIQPGPYSYQTREELLEAWDRGEHNVIELYGNAVKLIAAAKTHVPEDDLTAPTGLIMDVFYGLVQASEELFGIRYIDVLAKTWDNQVAKRNWKQNAVTGDS